MYWKVSGIWRDSHVLCHTNQTSCTVEFDVTISIHLLLAYHDYSVCTGESPTLRCSHTHWPISFSPVHLTVHITKGATVRKFLSNSGAFEK